MTHYKRITACLLAVVMLISAFSSAAVAAVKGFENDGDYPSIFIPGIFQSDVRLLDENGNELLDSEGKAYSKPFFTESTKDIVKDALENVLVPISRLLITQRDKDHRTAKAIAEVLGRSLLNNIRLDDNGNIINNIKATEYNTALSNLSEKDRRYILNQIPLYPYVEAAGDDHLYFFSYVSTGNLIQTAERLYELIQTAKSESGKDKVNLVPISQGGSLFNALMQLYRDKGLELSDDINRVCFLVPAADGAAVLGDIYRYGLLDDPEALYGYMFPSLLGDDQEALAYLINIILRIFPNADLNSILDIAVDTLIEDYLENCTCLWALIPSGDYPECRAKYLEDEDSKNIVKQTDWYYNAQLNHRKYILEEQEKGVKFFDIVDYNYPLYKICDSWDKVNADGIIHTDSESFGATSVAVDKALPDDYIQSGKYCNDPSHNHIDADRLIDASSGILCESTFYFKGQGHESTARNTVIIRLATRILTDPSFESVYSDPAFPQFNFARDSRGFENDVKSWKNADTSSLSEEEKQALNNALEKAEAAINSTVMTYEAFEDAKEDFYKSIDEIRHKKPEKEKSTKLLDFITKIVKWYSETLLKFFGEKGFSDILIPKFNIGGK